MSTDLTILNLGAGVQSTVVYLMALRGEIKIDCAIFSDLGEEPQAVYSHLEWLKSLNGPQIHTTSIGRLGDHLLAGQNSTGQRYASIPAFTAAEEGGAAGRVRRQCTAEYKVAPIEKFIRRTLLGLAKGERMPTTTRVGQLFGISLDEAGRATRIRQNSPLWSVAQFPLIDRMMTRDDCVEWLKDFGTPHTVPRSACVFCPFKSDNEWLRLRTHDAVGWARAVEIDRALRTEGTVFNRNMNEKMYLHRSCRPLEVAHLNDADRGQSTMFEAECEGGCGL